MDFKSYVAEDNEPDKINKIISADCYPFLKESHALELYKGYANTKYFKRVIPGLYKIKVIKNRKPLLGNNEYFNLFNKAFEEKFHIPKIRSISVVSSGNIDVANDYGDVYKIYPIGYFSYIWSPKVEDAYIEWDAVMTELEYKGAGPELSDKQKAMKKLVSSYKMKDLAKGLRSGNEILFQCEEYYAVAEGLDGL